LIAIDKEVDYSRPAMRIYNKTNGNYLGSLSILPYGNSLFSGIASDYNEVYLYVAGGDGKIRKWNGYEWSDFGDVLENSQGVAYGWNHVFVVHSYNTYEIRVFKSDGTFVKDISLNNWGDYYMCGLCRGRDNVVNSSESIYVACHYPASVIKEIEIGDFNQTDIKITSFGDIKALFK
jgi:hypothetical protein